jgi:hypothetical protein
MGSEFRDAFFIDINSISARRDAFSFGEVNGRRFRIFKDLRVVW